MHLVQLGAFDLRRKEKRPKKYCLDDKKHKKDTSAIDNKSKQRLPPSLDSSFLVEMQRQEPVDLPILIFVVFPPPSLLLDGRGSSRVVLHRVVNRMRERRQRSWSEDGRDGEDVDGVVFFKSLSTQEGRRVFLLV